MSDEDRLREHLRRAAEGVPDLADLDDVATRLGGRRPVRERRLLALVALALLAGVAGGVVLGVNRGGDGSAVTVGGEGSIETTTGPTTSVTTSTWQTCLQTNQMTVTVPNVVGETQSIASQTLAALHLLPATMPVNSGVPVGIVVAQDPAEGSDVGNGSAVTISVSAGEGSDDTVRAPSPHSDCSTPTEPAQTLPAPGPDQPTDPVAARRLVQNAYTEAYDGLIPDDMRASAIEGGGGLTSAFEALRTGPNGPAVQRAKTIIDGIVFLSATRAQVEFHSELGGGSTSGPYFGDAVRNGDTWQVSHASYCRLVTLARARCPD